MMDRIKIDLYLPEVFYFLNNLLKLSNELRFTFNGFYNSTTVYSFKVTISNNSATFMVDLSELLDSINLSASDAEYDTIKMALLQSGVAKPTGIDEISKHIEYVKETNVKVAFLFDTNAFILRIISNIFYMLIREMNIRPEFLLLYVSPLVRRELNRLANVVTSTKSKFDKKNLKNLRKELFGKIGLRELDYYTKRNIVRYTTTTSKKDISESNLAVDETILQDYVQFVDTNKERTVFYLVTTDVDFSRIAKSEGLATILLRDNITLERLYVCNINQLSQLVYIFTTLFGKLGISVDNAPSTLIFSRYKRFYADYEYVSILLNRSAQPAVSDFLTWTYNEFKMLRKLRELRGELDELY